ncbi:MAG: DUF4105 domain-containing protein [Xanthomonadaceae bacterium]|jgi:hypothetical protein|nr:DUF4105 domain-containing protein [Xanthomonadaceae bacterium]
MVRRAHRWSSCWLAALLTLTASIAAAAPRIGVMTMQPGEAFFERFGHNAIVVADPDTGAATSYNYGFFDPAESDFVVRFIRGEMMYYLVALPLEDDLVQYRMEGRGADLQWLDLRPEQAQRMADLLAEQARPENARYRYDYFDSNCATQVRDALDKALNGTLRPQLQSQARGNTYRSEAVRLARPVPWMWVVFDLGLGPKADESLNGWSDAFIPMRLADSLAKAKNSDGRPLVQERQSILRHRLAPEPVEQAREWWPWLLAGAGIGLAIVVVGRFAPRAVAALAIPFWLLCALLGALLLFLWGFTGHWAAWGNRNALLLNPLCLLLIPLGWRVLCGCQPQPLLQRLLWLIAILAALAPLTHWLSEQPQHDLNWIALLPPIHLALAWRFTRLRFPSYPRPSRARARMRP